MFLIFSWWSESGLICIGFVLSLIYLVYILVTKQRASKDYFSSEYYKKFLNVILFLWLVTMVFLLDKIQSQISLVQQRK